MERLREQAGKEPLQHGNRHVHGVSACLEEGLLALSELINGVATASVTEGKLGKAEEADNGGELHFDWQLVLSVRIILCLSTLEISGYDGPYIVKRGSLQATLRALDYDPPAPYMKQFLYHACHIRLPDDRWHYAKTHRYCVDGTRTGRSVKLPDRRMGPRQGSCWTFPHLPR